MKMPDLSNVNVAEGQGFRLIFPIIPKDILTHATIREQEVLDLHITDTVLPALDLDVEDTSHIFKYRQITGRLTYSPWTFNFLCDEKLVNYSIIFQWIQYIWKNYGDTPGHTHKEYIIDASLEIVTSFRKRARLFNFKNMYPTSLGEVTYDYTNPTWIKGSCTFEYSHIKMEE